MKFSFFLIILLQLHEVYSLFYYIPPFPTNYPWPSLHKNSSNGNHRVLVKVHTGTDAVLAKVEWRRRDEHVQRKSVHVFYTTFLSNSTQTIDRIYNALVVQASSHVGFIVFQALNPGNYLLVRLFFSFF